MDAPFHGGSNETTGGRVQPWRPEILLSSHGSILVLVTRFAVLQKKIDLGLYNSMSPV
jgi:hypothetical protein